MKTPLLILTIVLVFSPSCKDNDPPIIIEDMQQTVLNQLSEHIYFGTYSQLSIQSNQLYANVQAFAQNPTVKGLEQCRADWKQTREFWEYSEAWLFGPVATESIDPRIDTWPVDFIRLDSVLNSSATFSNAYINSLEASLKGFHPIEYLLFGKNGNKQLSEFNSRQLEFLLALTENLKQLTSELNNAWELSKGNYISEIQVGGPLKLYPNRLSAYEEICNAMIGICDEVANGKINEVFVNLDSMGEESPFAKNSINDFTNNIKGVQMVYLGNTLAGDARGVEDFVRTYNLSLDGRIKQKIQLAISALGQITDPFGKAIFTQSIQVQNTIDAINALKTELETGLLPLIQIHAK